MMSVLARVPRGTLVLALVASALLALAAVINELA
jgi:hypothetical protein